MLSNDVFRVPVGALCLGQFVNRRESGFGTRPVRLQCRNFKVQCPIKTTMYCDAEMFTLVS